MRKLLLCVLLFVSFSTHARDYSCFTPGIRQYFVNTDTTSQWTQSGYLYSGGYMRGMRIDSVRQSGASTIYYPFHSVRGIYGEVTPPLPGLDTNGGSWLGKTVVEQANGTFLFDNYWGDTVIIKTQANVGDTWMLYDDTTNWYYTATMESKGVLQVLGNLDSIKTIKISAFKAGIANIADPLNNLRIIISKSHGFVQVCDLYMFPMHRPGIAYKSYGLSGLHNFDYYTDKSTNSSPNLYNLTFHLVPFHNPTIAEVNSLNVGDVFESFGAGGTSDERRHLDTVVKRWVYSDHYEYEVIEHVNQTVRMNNIFKDQSFTSIYTLSVDNSLMYDTLQLMPEDYKLRGRLYHYWPADTGWCFTSDAYSIESDFIYGGGKDAAGNIVPAQVNTFEPCGMVDMFKIGFGHNADSLGVRYDSYLPDYLGYGILGTITGIHCFDPSTPTDNTMSTLTYVHKAGGGGCGNYVALAAKNVARPLSGISIYPNPATEQLSVKLPAGSAFQLSLINSIGQVLYTNVNAKGIQQLNTNGIPTGMYLLQVKDADGNTQNNKVVIQH